jgi:alkane 1-monooxygenase
MTGCVLWPAATAAGFGAAWGAAGAAVFLGAAAGATALQGVITYVQHYGLKREPLPSGAPEPVADKHSWSGDHLVGGSVFLRLARHATHHREAHLPFYSIGPAPEAPKMPLSYPAMVVMALLPPLWFRVMDPRVRALRAADASPGAAAGAVGAKAAADAVADGAAARSARDA